MKTLETKLGYQFQNPKLLDHALTHSSYANEHHLGSISSNERLEFLGDSVLGMIVADHLYRTFPDLPEGDLTRIRANLVCEGSLVLVAKEWDLGRYLKLGKGENACGGRSRPSILADAVEAVLAAVFLDGGLAHDRDIIQRFLLDRMEQVNRASRDHKTWYSGRAARCSATSSSASPAPTTTRPSKCKFCSTASPSARARDTARRRRNRRQPMQRSSGWRGSNWCSDCY